VFFSGHFKKFEKLETPKDDSSKTKAGIVFRKHTEALSDESRFGFCVLNHPGKTAKPPAWALGPGDIPE
jgi:hypothetical protein